MLEVAILRKHVASDVVQSLPGVLVLFLCCTIGLLGARGCRKVSTVKAKQMTDPRQIPLQVSGRKGT